MKRGWQRGFSAAAGLKSKLSSRLSGTVAIWFLPVLVIALFVHLGFAETSTTISQTPRAVKDQTARVVAHQNPAQKMRLTLALKPPHLDEEERFLRELSDPDSPNFHHYLTFEQWNARFAPSAQDEQAVVDWARQQGFSVRQRWQNRLVISVEAPVSRVENAFQVSINLYDLNGRTFFSNDRPPQIPGHLATILGAVVGLDNLEVAHTMSRLANPQPQTQPLQRPGNAEIHLQGDATAARTDSGMKPADSYGAMGPGDIYAWTAYNYQALQNLGHCCNPLNNPNQSPPEASIGIVIWGDFTDTDLTSWVQTYPYLAHNVVRHPVDGGPVSSDIEANAEATLDVEWSLATSNSFGSAANTAQINIYESANNQHSSQIDALQHMLNDGIVRVVNMSWGGAENHISSTTVNSYHSIFNQMVGQGWTLVAASGDGGATTDCQTLSVSYPASDPDVTAAGGTYLQTNLSYFGMEIAWNGIHMPGSCAQNDGGSGGGCSVVFPAPAYQTNQACGVGSRSVPDIALNATQQNFFFQGSMQGVGGTSIAAPEMAGFFAQENAYLLYLGSIVGNTCGNSSSSACAPLGAANPALYDEATTRRAPHYPFFDIVEGNNGNDITDQFSLTPYSAGPGYDMVTGWGSANMLQLAWTFNNWLAGDGGKPVVTWSGPTLNQWFSTDQTISWTVADKTGSSHPANGIAGSGFAWDTDPGDSTSGRVSSGSDYFNTGIPYTTASHSVQLSNGGQGCHIVHVRAWDNAGLGSGDVTYGPVCYDTLPPYSYFSVSGTGDGQGNYLSPVQLSMGSYDYLGSGVAATYVQLDGGAWQTYTSPVTITALGTHTLQYYSVDRVGNTESVKTGNFTLVDTALLTVKIQGTDTGATVGDGGQITCPALSCSATLFDGSTEVLYVGGFGPLATITWQGCDRTWWGGSFCEVVMHGPRALTVTVNNAVPLRFVPITPCRVVDTRNTSTGGPYLAAGTSRDFGLPAGPCNLPTSAAAYSLNATVVPHEGLGYLTLWPTGNTRPTVSTLNSIDGRIKASAAILPTGTNGSISAYATGDTDLVLDVNGYFVPPSDPQYPTALEYYSLSPCRVLDTRNPSGPLGGPGLTAGQTRNFPVKSSPCGIPTNARAYTMNATVVPPNMLGYLTLWPSDQPQPLVSTLNDLTGTIVANAAIVPGAAGSGDISAFVSNDSHLAMDITGYFAPPSSSGWSLYTIAPCRAYDSRPTPFVGQTYLVSECTYDPPTPPYASVINATVIPSGPLGYLTLWPIGGIQPVVSTLNALDGAITSNMAVVLNPSNDALNGYATNPTNIVIDATGIFAP